MSAATFNAVFFEDRFVPVAEAKVPVTDRGYLLGEGVFATLRGYGGTCFRPQRHLETLARGAALFGMTLPADLDRLAELADEAAVFTGAADAYVRITIARGGDGARGVLSVLARGFDIPSAAEYEHGIPVTFVSQRRVPPECMDPTVKTTSYAPSVLARREAGLRGARDGLQLATDGSLACGTMANVFVFVGGRLFTPPITTGCRAGVTREAVLELAPQLGIETRVERIDPAALFEADEIFLTSTRIECLPVRALDGGRVVGNGTYPRTAALRQELQALVARETAARRSAAG